MRTKVSGWAKGKTEGARTDGGEEKEATGLKGKGEFLAEKKGDSGNRPGARKTK